MHIKRHVLIIGTEPPCPRCDLVDVLVNEAAKTDIEVEHCAFDSPQALKLGKALGRKVGTAKHVAKDAGIEMDWDAVYKLIDSRKASLQHNIRPADTWTPELDETLEPCRKASDKAGYLMTPVIVIDGKVLHHGNVPSSKQIAMLLK